MQLDSEKRIIEAARFAINNTKEEAHIRQQMEVYGFGSTRLKQGETLLNKAQQSIQEKDRCYQGQWELSQQIKAQSEAIQTQVRDHISIARVAYRQDVALLHLLRIETMARPGWSLVWQAEYFYNKLREQKLSLATYGVSDAIIQQAARETGQLLALREKRARQKAQAENSTQTKRTALRELRAWVMEFRGAARLAFRSEPQWLEAFGMTTRAVV